MGIHPFLVNEEKNVSNVIYNSLTCWRPFILPFPHIVLTERELESSGPLPLSLNSVCRRNIECGFYFFCDFSVQCDLEKVTFIPWGRGRGREAMLLCTLVWNRTEREKKAGEREKRERERERKKRKIQGMHFRLKQHSKRKKSRKEREREKREGYSTSRGTGTRVLCNRYLCVRLLDCLQSWESAEDIWNTKMYYRRE